MNIINFITPSRRKLHARCSHLQREMTLLNNSKRLLDSSGSGEGPIRVYCEKINEPQSFFKIRGITMLLETFLPQYHGSMGVV